MMKLSEVMAQSPPPQESDAGGGLKLSEVTKLSDIQAPAQAPAQSGGGLTFDSAPVVPDIAGSSGVSVTPDLAATSPLVGGINEQKTDFGRSSNTGTTNDRIRNLITGDHLKTEYTESLPQIERAPELQNLSRGSILANAGTLLTRDPQALEGVIKKQFGNDASFSEDEKGNIFATLPSGTYQLNKPGIGLRDAAAFGVEALVLGAAGAPSIAARGLLKGGAIVAGKTAVGQAMLEGAEKFVGGEFDPINIALATVGGGIAGASHAKNLAKNGVAPAQQTLEEQRLVAQIARKTMPHGEAETFLTKIGNKTPPPPDVDSIDPDVAKSLDDLLIDDDTTAQFVVDGSGKLKSSPAGLAALSNGHDPAVVTSLIGANKATKDVANKMLHVQRRSLADATYASEVSPSVEIGKVFEDRIKTALGVRKKAGARLNIIADGLKNTPVNTTNTKEVFLDQLIRGHGVKLTADGLDFSQSTFQSAILKPTQNRIQTIYDKLFVSGIRNGADAHRFKGTLDELIPNQLKDESGVSAKMEALVVETRTALNKSIREVSTEYAGVNDRLSPVLETFERLQKGIGTSIDLDAPSAAESLGRETRGLLSNRKTRGQLSDAVDGLDAIARRETKKDVANLRSLARFSTHLEDVFGTNDTASFGGIIERKLAANERQKLISSNPLKAAGEIGLQKTGEFIGEKLGKSELDQIKILRDLVMEGR